MSDAQHILVVEDEEHLATGIKYNLVAEGYRVTTTGDGPSALKLIQENPDDVDLVGFRVNGRLVRVEFRAPFDLGGTRGSRAVLVPLSLPAGAGLLTGAS